MQLSRVNQSEIVPLVESPTTAPKNDERPNIAGIADNIFTCSCIEMTETLGIDKFLLKVERSQGRVNEFFIKDNQILRKNKRKFKPVDVANKINKLMIENNMKDEEKIEIFSNTHSKLYAGAVRYDKNMSCKKNINLAKIYDELLFCDRSMFSDMDGTSQNLCTNSALVFK